MAATYALDITNKRVQNAMAVLGIEETELIVKTLEDFAGPHVSPEIQELRYTYHRKKVEETKKKIKYQIREDRQRQGAAGESISVKSLRSPNGSHMNFRKSVSLANFLEYESRKLQQAKEKHRKSVIRTLQMSKEVTPKAAGKPIEDEESPLKEAMLKRREELEKRRQKHEQKLEEIQKNREERQKELIKSMSRSMREHEERGRRLEEKKREELQERTKSFQEKQQEILRRLNEREEIVDKESLERLSSIEAKISKNRELHAEALRKRAERAAKTVEKADAKTSKFDAFRSAQEVERIKQYITAQQQARERKTELTSEQMAKFEKQREKADAKMNRIKELQKKEKQEEDSNIRRLEKKMNTASRVLEKKQQEWTKELELRLEMQRLMDEDKRSKVERAQRRYNLKRTKILDKLVQERDKAEQLRHEQFMRETKHQETAIKIMIDKEKATEAQELASKSPLSKLTQEKLSEMEIKVEVDRKEEKDVQPPINT